MLSALVSVSSTILFLITAHSALGRPTSSEIKRDVILSSSNYQFHDKPLFSVDKIQHPPKGNLIFHSFARRADSHQAKPAHEAAMNALGIHIPHLRDATNQLVATAKEVPGEIEGNNKVIQRWSNIVLRPDPSKPEQSERQTTIDEAVERNIALRTRYSDAQEAHLEAAKEAQKHVAKVIPDRDGGRAVIAEVNGLVNHPDLPQEHTLPKQTTHEVIARVKEDLKAFSKKTEI